jgi:hypothetical protein
MRTIHVIAAVLALYAATLNRAAADTADDDAMRKKLAPIIDCINHSDVGLQQNFDRYRWMLNNMKTRGETKALLR